MEQKIVRRLETEIEDAFADVIVGKLPLLPSRETIHLMAKAAVTVYDAAVENHGGSPNE